MPDFVVVGSEMRYRAWIDPARCPHSNTDLCATCDFDRYYATTYANVPWAVDEEHERGIADAAAEAEQSAYPS